MIYGEQCNSIECIIFDDIEKEIIEIDCRKKELGEENCCRLKNKTGVYIFVENTIPIYIGVGGTGKKDDLRTRIKAETRSYSTSNNNATLSKNIQEIDSLLMNTKVTEVDSMNKIKGCKVMVLVVGDMSDDSNKDKSIALESVLIALFNTKYNK